MEKEELEKRVSWYEKNYGPYIEKTGLSNWKNLFRKPTSRDILLLVIIIFVLLGAVTYKYDIQTCQETLKNLPKDVCEACSQLNSMNNESIYQSDFSNIKINGD